MMQVDAIRTAAGDVLAAALLGEGWQTALEHLARAAGARDAVLMRNAPSHMVCAITTEEATEAVAQFAAGRTPPNSRYGRVKTRFGDGFRFDHDDYTDDELARDPFYQEFLRPQDLFWHANVAIAAGTKGVIELSLKRRIGAGPYERRDALLLDQAVPELRAAAQMASFVFDAETRGMARVLASRARSVLELDRNGRVRHAIGAETEGGPWPLRIERGRLMSADRLEQPRLDACLANLRRTAAVPVTASDGARYVLQIHPVPGAARDVFLSASALAILIERDQGSEQPATRIARDLWGLTARESEVAGLLAAGASVTAIAIRLGIAPGTVRTHVKIIFDKTGARRQAELVAMMAQMADA